MSIRDFICLTAFLWLLRRASGLQNTSNIFPEAIASISSVDESDPKQPAAIPCHAALPVDLASKTTAARSPNTLNSIPLFPHVAWNRKQMGQCGKINFFLIQWVKPTSTSLPAKYASMTCLWFVRISILGNEASLPHIRLHHVQIASLATQQLTAR